MPRCGAERRRRYNARHFWQREKGTNDLAADFAECVLAYDQHRRISSVQLPTQSRSIDTLSDEFDQAAEDHVAELLSDPVGAALRGCARDMHFFHLRGRRMEAELKAVILMLR